ncbi:hypothetical protein FB451DRAFT_1185653 [Mycena latifolia]|nr:hypothetical protein FB451DRAFT_1185653 [Mycena latifolia]
MGLILPSSLLDYFDPFWLSECWEVPAVMTVPDIGTKEDLGITVGRVANIPLPCECQDDGSKPATCEIQAQPFTYALTPPNGRVEHRLCDTDVFCAFSAPPSVVTLRTAGAREVVKTLAQAMPLRLEYHRTFHNQLEYLGYQTLPNLGSLGYVRDGTTPSQAVPLLAHQFYGHVCDRHGQLQFPATGTGIDRTLTTGFGCIWFAGQFGFSFENTKPLNNHWVSLPRQLSRPHHFGGTKGDKVVRNLRNSR